MGSANVCCRRADERTDVSAFDSAPGANRGARFDAHVEALNNAADEEIGRERRRLNGDADAESSAPSECSTVVYRRNMS
jgi:hypothetical protein